MHLLLIFRENLPIQSLEKQGRAPTEGACLSHGGDHYDHRTDRPPQLLKMRRARIRIILLPMLIANSNSR